MINYRKEIEKLGLKKELLKEQMQGLYDSVHAESRAFNEDEQTKFDELKAQCGVIDAEAANLSVMQNMEIADSEVVTDANRVADETAQTQSQQPEQFASLGEQLMAVRHAFTPGVRDIDPRLSMVGPNFGAAVTGLSEGITSDGGFLVQTDLVSGLIQPVFEGGQIMSRVMQIPIGPGFNGTKMNAIDETSRKHGSRWGGIRAFWASEAEEKTASKPKLRQIEINLKKLIGLCYATDELLQDAVALEGVIRAGFTDEFIFITEDAIVEGTGAGMPLGVMNAGAKLQISKETSQAATTLIAENVEKMYARMPSRSLATAVWTINQDVWPQIFQFNHSVGTGGVPMFIPAGGLTDTPAGTLLGRPIVPTEYNETLGTAGDIMFADFSQYLFGSKGSMESASSIHVRFIYDEQVFRFVWRVDGQPIPASAITPFKGTKTQSPFIVLQTRS